MVSFGGRYILIANVPQSMPIYLLSVINPRKGVIKRIHQLLAKFFWSRTGGLKGKHWFV